MNRYALPLEEVRRLAGLFQGHLASLGIAREVEVGRYVEPGFDTYGAADPDAWDYDDYSLTIPDAPGVVEEHGPGFVAGLGDPDTGYHLDRGHLVIVRKRGR